MKIASSIEDMIGGTPLVRLSRLERELGLSCTLLAKVESRNPAGSVKDRAALCMIDSAMREGRLSVGDTIVEPTSGNTGIGLCAVAAVRGLRCVIVMPESMSRERRMLMRAYGAQLVLTPAAEGMKGAIRRAEELVREIPHAYLIGQFDNPDNARAHYETTGPEIYVDTDGDVDVFVAGIGTGGTVTGIGRYLKEKKPEVRIVGVEPSDSPYLTEGRAGAHALQGIGAGFAPSILDRTVIDEIQTVTKDEAYRMARLMGTHEGLLVGISAGAALAAAVKIGKRTQNENKTVVVLLPDGGERYLSSDLYDEI